MGSRKQAKWDVTEIGMLTVLLPSGLTADYDLTHIFKGWADYTEAEMFLSGYGVKQKLSDLCAASKDATYTDKEKIERMTELFDYAVKHEKMPKTERKGGFGISKKKIAESIEKREVPLTDEQEAILKELGLM